MERYIWTAKVLPGKLDEYVRRHREMWPEMTEALNQAGIHNYTIWQRGDRLIGYYECESVRRALEIQDGTPVVQKWRDSMKNLMAMEANSGDDQASGFRQVYYHE